MTPRAPADVIVSASRSSEVTSSPDTTVARLGAVRAQPTRVFTERGIGIEASAPR